MGTIIFHAEDKMTNRTPDDIVACRRIASARREEREYARRTRKVKSITIPLEMIEGLQLSSHIAISHNSATGVVLVQSSSLVFKKYRTHPGTHCKRRCGSEKALKMLEDARRYSREGSRKRRSQLQNL